MFQVTPFTGQVTSPWHTYGPAVGPNGDLWVCTSWTPAGTKCSAVSRRGGFQVVAGDGDRGFSGDGGLATKARLDLSPSSGIAVSHDGTLYIADTGNDRVRAVSPAGTIRTVAGDGETGPDGGMVLHPTPALEASLGQVHGLAIGPGGDLFIAAGNVVRLAPGGQVDWVAGKRTPFACGSSFCNPASQADFTHPDQLAFDRQGDMFVSTWSSGSPIRGRNYDLEY